MRLFVRHRSEYAFSQPQARIVQLLRLTPGNHHGQNIVSWRIDVDRDARLKPARDGYGNEATMLYIDGPIDRIALDVTGEVMTEDRAGMVRGAAEPLPPVYFLQQTALTKPDREIEELGRAFATGGDALDRAHRLAEAIEARLERMAPRNVVDQRAAVRLEAGTADPQGAAHVLIAAARAAGYPARYVAGHLYRPETIDSHTAHGWAELFVEGYGWIGFDALEGRCPTDDYVRIAVGLDHREAAPLSGARIGGGREALSVNVHVGPEPAPQD